MLWGALKALDGASAAFEYLGNKIGVAGSGRSSTSDPDELVTVWKVALIPAEHLSQSTLDFVPNNRISDFSTDCNPDSAPGLCPRGDENDEPAADVSSTGSAHTRIFVRAEQTLSFAKSLVACEEGIVAAIFRWVSHVVTTRHKVGWRAARRRSVEGSSGRSQLISCG